MNKLTISAEARQFAQLVADGVDCWRQAGKILTRHAEDTLFIRECAAAARLSEHTVRLFLRIGQGTVNPRLLVRDSCPAVKRALSLPLAEQYRLEMEGVQVLIGDETQTLPIFELGKRLAAQAIGDGAVRTIAEQADWLKRTARGAPAPGWKIVGDRVVFTKATVLSAREIEHVLAELAKPEEK
jgi:hypothetical protein